MHQKSESHQRRQAHHHYDRERNSDPFFIAVPFIDTQDVREESKCHALEFAFEFVSFSFIPKGELIPRINCQQIELMDSGMMEKALLDL